MEPDAEFAEKLYRKDEEAVRIFIKEFKTPLYNYIYRIVYNRQDAEDILQEVFLKIFKNIRKIDFSRNYKSFIYTLTRNSALDFIKNRKNEYELDEKTAETEDSYERLQTKDIIEKALQNISTEERELILLKYVQNLKISEISEILKIHPNTIKVRIFRAIRKMRDHIQKEEKLLT